MVSADFGPAKFKTRYYEKKDAAFVNASMQNESATIPSLGTDDAVGGDASTSISKSTRKLANRLIAKVKQTVRTGTLLKQTVRTGSLLKQTVRTGSLLKQTVRTG